MIESIENAVQIAATCFCAVFATVKAVGQNKNKRLWIILAFAGGVFFLGDIYWELYLGFYGFTPQHSYISYFSWYAGLLFLLILVIELRDETRARLKRKWLLPAVFAFTIGLCIFYMQYGDWLGNIITVLIMSPLMWQAIDAFLVAREEKKYLGKSDPRCGFYRTILLLCLAEYGMWTASCLWGIYSSFDPYYVFDALLSLSFVLLPFMLRKAVDR